MVIQSDPGYLDWRGSNPKRVTASAYAYAEAAADPITGLPPGMPDELLILTYIDRFGVMAIMGRETLSAGEVRRMMIAENIVRAYQERKASGDWGTWAQENPGAARLLADIEKVINA